MKKSHKPPEVHMQGSCSTIPLQSRCLQALHKSTESNCKTL